MNQNAAACAYYYFTKGGLTHDCPYKYGAGENLAYNYNKTAPALAATDLWYNEVSKYDYNNPGFRQDTGHFTQLVWKSSTKFGIGVWADQSSGIQYVCGLYSPQGNVDGQFPDNVVAP